VRNLNKKARFRTTIGTFSKDKTQIQPKQTLKAEQGLPSALIHYHPTSLKAESKIQPFTWVAYSFTGALAKVATRKS